MLTPTAIAPIFSLEYFIMHSKKVIHDQHMLREILEILLVIAILEIEEKLLYALLIL